MQLINNLFSLKGSPFTDGHKRYICDGCNRRWCTVLDNDNTNSLCTKMQFQKHSGYCTMCLNDSQYQKDLQSQKDDNNNTSPLSTTTTNSSVIISNISSTTSTHLNPFYRKDWQHCNLKHTTETIIETLSPKQSTSIINIAESTYQLKNNVSINKFETMAKAKDYFTRKFSYMTLDSSSKTNIFNFNCPRSCQKSHTIDYPIYEKFHIDTDAINSIFDTNWLNDSAINLVLACLNFVSINTTKKSVVKQYTFNNNKSIHGFITNFEKTFYRVNNHGSSQFYTSTFKWTNASIKETKGALQVKTHIKYFVALTPMVTMKEM